MKDYHSMNADQMSAELREMAELAPTPDLQECYQRAAALLGVAQGAQDHEALQAAWAEGYEFGLNSRDKTPGDIEPLLKDPVAVHINMLRGRIAKPSWAAIKHLYPEHFQPEASQHPEGMRQSPALNDVLESCKIEHKKFEEWAAAQKYDMHEHPLHYLFLDPQTNAARQGWKAALRYVAEATSPPSTQSLRQEG